MNLATYILKAVEGIRNWKHFFKQGFKATTKALILFNGLD